MANECPDVTYSHWGLTSSMVCIKSTVEARSHRTGAEECHDDVISQFAFELRIKAKEEEVGK